VVRSLAPEKISRDRKEIVMLWDTIFVVVATLWAAGAFFGLVLPDEMSKKILCWIAEVEHQPLWWLPVGVVSLVLFGYGLSKAVEINVNWLVLVRAAFSLIGVGISALIWIFVRRRRSKSSSSTSEFEEDQNG